jgi:hypothetical protein
VLLAGEKQVFVTPSTYQVARAPTIPLRLELEGYRTHEERLAIPPTETARVIRVTLQSLRPAAGGLEIRTNVTQATWRLDGKPVGDGTGVLRLDALPPGPHQVSVEAAGHEAHTEIVEVAAGKRVERGWTLTTTAGAKRGPKRGPAGPTAPAREKAPPTKKDPGRVRVFDKL